ncbi:MAG: hypothetical protein LKK00_10145, partial [Intestinimonas sp.]|nr:hypothetical protein [Intestinimonas sp.]
FVVLALIMLEQRWLFLALLWVAFCWALGRAANEGRPARLAAVLTPNFYAVRCLNGRWSIFQRRPKRDWYEDRTAYLKALVAEKRLLPAALKPGRYQAVTHGMVLRRLMAMKNAADLQVTPAYRAALQAQRGRGYRAGRKGEKRQFYLVRFTITEQ